MLTTANDNTAITTTATWKAAGIAANNAAARSAFAIYQERKATATTRRQKGDLDLFTSYLAEVGLITGDLENNPEAWEHITWGMVAGFQTWQLKAGYAVGSVNVRMSTVKRYAKLAMKAGTLPQAEYVYIATIDGYARKDRKRIDDRRANDGTQTRTGSKKAEPVTISTTQAAALMAQPTDTAQGRRDQLLMAIMLDHGLRVGEVAILTVESFDLAAGTMTFYRPKVQRTQTHKLTTRTLAAAKAYLQDAPTTGIIWRASASKGDGHNAAGTLTTQGLPERSIAKRVMTLAKKIGLIGLSPHDCRHYWATQAALHNTPLNILMDAGGWNSPAMPMRYIETAKIANDGLILE